MVGTIPPRFLAPGGVLLARRPHRRREEHEQKAVRNLKIDKDFLFGVRLISTYPVWLTERRDLQSFLSVSARE
jgi:hypothetical protein